jgi:hypothetical protein
VDTLRPEEKQQNNSSNEQMLEKMKAEMSAWKKTRRPVMHTPEIDRRGRNRR